MSTTIAKEYAELHVMERLAGIAVRMNSIGKELVKVVNENQKVNAADAMEISHACSTAMVSQLLSLGLAEKELGTVHLMIQGFQDDMRKVVESLEFSPTIENPSSSHSSKDEQEL